MIKIDGVSALELRRAGYKVKRYGRAFFVNERSIIKYIIKGRAA
jgi:hypothetical protein